MRSRPLRLAGARGCAVLRQPVFQVVHLFAQPLCPLGELIRLARIRDVLRRIGATRRVGQRTLLRRQLLRFIAEGLHCSFVRRPLQYLGAFLELLAHPLLQLREIAQGVPRLVAIHLLRRGLELLHLRHHLRRHRLSEQFLRLTKLARERAVQRASSLELLLELLGRLAKLVHPVRHRPLLLRERASLLRILELHRVLLLACRAGGRIARSGPLPGLRASGFVRLLCKLTLRLGGGLRFFHRCIAERARDDSLLLARCATQHQFAAHPALGPRRRVHRFRAHAHGVARLEVQRDDIDRHRTHPARAHIARHGEQRRRRVRRTARGAHGNQRHAVIVRHLNGQRNGLGVHEQRVHARRRDHHVRRRIGDDVYVERLREIGHQTARAARRPAQLHGMFGGEPAVERLSRRSKGNALAASTEQRDVGERHRGASGNRQYTAARQTQPLAHRERLISAPEVGGIVRLERERANKWAVSGVDDNAVARRPAIRGDKAKVAAQRLDGPVASTRRLIDGDCVGAPGVAGLANIEIHDATTRSEHPQPERGSAQQLPRRAVDARALEQTPTPGVQRPHHRAKSVAEHRRCRAEEQQPRRGGSGADQRAPRAGAAHRRRQWLVHGQRLSHSNCGTLG